MSETSNTVDIFNKNAELYLQLYGSLELYNETYDFFLDHLKRDACVLDLACGPGNISRYLLSKKPELKILGVDLAPNMISVAKENNPRAEFKIMDVRDLEKIKKKFDGIICGFGAPYLSKNECNSLIKNVSSHLKEKGIFYLSAIEGNYEKSGYEFSSDGRDKAYVYYHEGNYLTDFFANNSLEMIKTFRKKFIKQGGEASVHLILIAVKK